MTRICHNCGTPKEVAYTLLPCDGSPSLLCSLECLNEFSWLLRSKREKLSKSQAQEGAPQA